MQSITRRRFLEDSMLAAAAAAAGATALPLWAQEKKPGSANNRIRVAILGCRIRGKQHAQELAPLRDCEIAYVCDPDRDLAGELAAAVEKQQGTAPKTVQDMRRVFDDRRQTRNDPQRGEENGPGFCCDLGSQLWQRTRALQWPRSCPGRLGPS